MRVTLRDRIVVTDFCTVRQKDKELRHLCIESGIWFGHNRVTGAWAGGPSWTEAHKWALVVAAQHIEFARWRNAR